MEFGKFSSTRIISKWRRSRTVLAFIGALALGGYSAQAVDYTWNDTDTSGDIGDWNTAGNWTPSTAVPGDTGTTYTYYGKDNVYLPSNYGETGNAALDRIVNVSSNVTVSTLNFGDSVNDDSSTSGYTVSSSPGIAITVSAGITGYNEVGTDTISANLVIAPSGYFPICSSPGGTLVISGNICETTSGSAFLAFGGPNYSIGGTLVLSGSNSYSGGSNLSGMVYLNNNSALGTGTITCQSNVDVVGNSSGSTVTIGNPLSFANGGTTGMNFVGPDNLVLTGNATMKSDRYADGGLQGWETFNVAQGANLTLAGVLSDDPAAVSSGYGMGLTKSGTGTLILSNTANQFTGQVSINSGTLVVTSLQKVGTPDSLGNQASHTALDYAPVLGSNNTPATLQYVGPATTTDRVFTFGGYCPQATIDASGSGPLTISGAFSGTAGSTLILSGSNTGLNTYSGAMSGTMSLEKSGAGTWVLSGANTYSGETTVASGTLLVSNTIASVSRAATGYGAVEVQGGATLGGGNAKPSNLTTISGTALLMASLQTYKPGAGSILGAVTVDDGGILTPGFNGVGTLNLSGTGAGKGGLTLSTGAIVNFQFNSIANSLISVGSSLTLQTGVLVNLLQENTSNPFAMPGTYNLFTYKTISGWDPSDFTVANAVDGMSYTFIDDTGDDVIQLMVVPEPATYAMLVGGVGALIFLRGMRRRSVV